MLCYRISRIVYADLSGNGARLYEGRWNSEGKAMVYLASSRSLAVLEALAHLSPTNIPDDLCMMIVDVPEEAFTKLDMKILPPHWNDFPEQNILKQMGNRFLVERRALMLKVPSAIVSEEFNYLLNPMHPRAIEAKVVSNKPFGFDARLL